ncbi:SPOSA6832_03247 [Sporobolomyces salmonicolor]|uniref:SPOSA6832_03247-mRNA-1:cds n=1 Tax=Sporidiobolus salmonicolor TaxID=5005 RepID=A0A0D6ENM5_SPOSA|nr:SPOSA6832_03247 [Sporobolomyces salmonicolor]
MTKIWLPASPPASPSGAPAPGLTHGARTSRSRLRPSVSTLGWALFHACVFLWYYDQLRSAPPRRPAAALPGPLLALNGSVSPALATSSCEVCILDPSDPLCEYGIDSVRLSRAYEGSGARLRRVLEKALRGEEVGIGVIGAAGHSVPVREGVQRWPERFFDDFQKLFPRAKLHVGAVAATDSKVSCAGLPWQYDPPTDDSLPRQFFSYCFEAVVPRDLDLYLVELDINNSPSEQTLHDDDALMRGLLELPQEPAVVRVAVFALMFDDLARGAMSTLITSQFFDVPVIRRHSQLPHSARDPPSRSRRNDLRPGLAWRTRLRELASSSPFAKVELTHLVLQRHISEVGHAAMADMLSLFVRKEVCETQRRQIAPPPPVAPASGWPLAEDLGKVPPLALWSSWLHPAPLVPISPLCQTAITPLSLLKPISHSPEFKLAEWNDKAAWASSTPGSQIRFSFKGTKVGIFIWASAGKGKDETSRDKQVRRREAPGTALCWIEEHALDEAEWNERYGGAEGAAAAPETRSWEMNSHWPERSASGAEFIELTEGLQPGDQYVVACPSLCVLSASLGS